MSDWLSECESIGGWMLTEELQWLHDAAAKHPVVVEVGVWLGRSTYALCAGCPGIVIAIDHFQGPPAPGSVWGDHILPSNPEEIARKNLGAFLSSGKLVLFQNSSDDVLKLLKLAEPAPFIDMLFIDGDHSAAGVRKDMELTRYLKSGGLLCGHDGEEPGVVEATSGFSRDIVENTTIWVRR